MPAELKAVRTLASFGDRLRARLDDVFVALPDGGGARFGFYFLKGDELYQFYVGREARGTGVAAVLMLGCLLVHAGPAPRQPCSTVARTVVGQVEVRT